MAEKKKEPAPAPPRSVRLTFDLDRETSVEARDDGADISSLDLVQLADADHPGRRVSISGTVPQLNALLDALAAARAAGYRV